MGATKRVAEEIVLASGGTVLRLGNILGSSGSVTEVFAGQIAQGGPLTVTDPGARRYFLTMDEAVNLLLHASALRVSSAVLAPILPACHGIAALAGFMASELAPGREIPIRFTGLRRGKNSLSVFGAKLILWARLRRTSLFPFSRSSVGRGNWRADWKDCALLFANATWQGR